VADALGIQAGSLTYGAFLSIPPALLIAGSVLGFVLAGDAEAQARVVDKIATAIPGLEPFVREFLQSAIDGRASVGLLGLVVLTWAASGFAAAPAMVCRKPQRSPVLAGDDGSWLP